MTINEFLTARFNEEHAELEAWVAAEGGTNDVLNRVLFDLTAKRLVVATLVQHERTARDEAYEEDQAEARRHLPGLEVACYALAQGFSSHPDFNDDWLI